MCPEDILVQLPHAKIDIDVIPKGTLGLYGTRIQLPLLAGQL